MEDFRDEVPVGFGFTMAMNKDAMINFGRMTEEQRKRIISESKQVRTKDEMSQLVDRIAANSF